MRVPVIVLTEGESDRTALEALAIRRGLDLAAAGILVQPMGGIGNLARFLERANTSPEQGSRRWGSSRARRTWRTSSSARPGPKVWRR